MKRFRLLILMLVVLTFSCSDVRGQSDLSGSRLWKSGPVGMDTSRFADLYIFREGVDSFPDNWFGIVLGEHQGLAARVNMGHIYLIRTRALGKVELWTEAYTRSSVTLDLKEGAKYYINLRILKDKEGKPDVHLDVLDSLIAQQRLGSYSGRLIAHYCEVPFGDNFGFLSDLYPDSVWWYADQTHFYRFLPLPSWDVLSRSKLRTTLGFRNSLISDSYSEVGGIMYLPKTRFESEREFDDYITGKARKVVSGSLGISSDLIRSWERVPSERNADAVYSAIVYCEAEDHGAANAKRGEIFLLRSAMLYVYWVNEEGKGSSACLYTSERGLPSELSSREDLLMKLYYTSSSLRIVHSRGGFPVNGN